MGEVKNIFRDENGRRTIDPVSFETIIAVGELAREMNEHDLMDVEAEWTRSWAQTTTIKVRIRR